jgi:hypothetical protein
MHAQLSSHSTTFRKLFQVTSILQSLGASSIFRSSASPFMLKMIGASTRQCKVPTAGFQTIISLVIEFIFSVHIFFVWGGRAENMMLSTSRFLLRCLPGSGFGWDDLQSVSVFPAINNPSELYSTYEYSRSASSTLGIKSKFHCNYYIIISLGNYLYMISQCLGNLHRPKGQFQGKSRRSARRREQRQSHALHKCTFENHCPAS